MERESFVFYRSFYEAIKELPAENQANVYNALFEYSFNNVEVELSGVEKAVFLLMKPQVDANQKKYENGCKGGRPKKQNQDETEIKPNQNQNETEIKPKQNQSKTEVEPNDNDNDNVNDNDNDNNKINEFNLSNVSGKRKVFVKPTVEEVRTYCRERRNNVNAENFINFYESKGWKVGNTPMKDWKACVRTWEQRDKSNKTGWELIE